MTSPHQAAPSAARPAATATDRLYSVETGNSAQTIAKMIRVLFPDAVMVLDATWGTGGFWSPHFGARSKYVIGLDRSPHGRPDVLGDFTRLPFRDGAFDLVVFDPPFISHASKAGTSKVDRRFSSYRSEEEALATVQAGAREAWRVARLGALVKVQNHVHASVYVDMEAWVREALAMPVYGHVEQIRPSKMIAPTWSDQLSVWSNSATFLAFRHGDQRHIRRHAPADEARRREAS
jgi:hypothetical protein